MSKNERDVKFLPLSLFASLVSSILFLYPGTSLSLRLKGVTKNASFGHVRRHWSWSSLFPLRNLFEQKASGVERGLEQLLSIFVQG